MRVKYSFKYLREKKGAVKNGKVKNVSENWVSKIWG